MKDTESWPAPAKINLFLQITGRRSDGYHSIQTLFQFLEIGDTLRFRIRTDGQINRVTQMNNLLPSDDLVVKAASLLQKHSGTPLGADIFLEKLIPIGGGLGGGSSDAATVLVALNELWSLGLSRPKLASLGLMLGADVPVFVNGRAAWAEGVGEILIPMDVDQSAAIVVTPGCQVDTARVFGQTDLTRNTPPITMHAASLLHARNDCEPVVRRLHPEVGQVLDWLSQFAEARMSGTGASVFALFDDTEAAAEVSRQVPQSWSSMTTRCVNRSPLLDFIEAR